MYMLMSALKTEPQRNPHEKSRRIFFSQISLNLVCLILSVPLGAIDHTHAYYTPCEYMMMLEAYEYCNCTVMVFSKYPRQLTFGVFANPSNLFMYV